MYKGTEFIIVTEKGLLISASGTALSLFTKKTKQISPSCASPTETTPTHLVVMARPLAVLCEGLQALVDELHIVGIDVEAEQH